MSLLINAKNLTKKFTAQGVETTALNSINITVENGEFVAIMGPSGGGKSTLLNVLGLLDIPSSGSYQILGQEVSTLREKEIVGFRKDNLGFIFQSFNLIDELSVRENVALPLLYKGVSAEECNRRVDAALNKMSISHRADHMPQQLSGGQQQRVAIARAVVSEPRILLADEPTGNLDTKNGQEVMALLTQLNKEGTSIIMVTHSPEHARYASRIITLVDGVLQTSGCETPRHKEVANA